MRRSRRPVWTKTYASADEIPLVSTTKEVAILLKMSEQWVKNNLQNGTLKGFKTGTKWKVYKKLKCLVKYKYHCTAGKSET